MTKRFRRSTIIILTLFSVLAVITAQTGASPEKVFTVEVAENVKQLVVAEAPVLDDGLPAYGNAYITQGYIYPKGTLLEGVSGTLEDGSPAFPDKVLGEWTSWGYHVGKEGAHTESGPFVTGFELFDFGTEHGRETILLGGVIPVDVVAPMAILGGTGPYANARGEANHEVLRFDEWSEGVQLRYTFKINAGAE
jgi:hypothetical protein